MGLLAALSAGPGASQAAGKVQIVGYKSGHDTVSGYVAPPETAWKPADAKIYSAAGHAFENPDNKAGYRAGDAADAWNRMVGFFNRTLKR